MTDPSWLLQPFLLLFHISRSDGIPLQSLGGKILLEFTSFIDDD